MKRYPANVVGPESCVGANTLTFWYAKPGLMMALPTVNCVSPGLIDTDFIADLPDKLRKEYLAAIPLKRFGTPDEVAASVLFLASRDADYITGSVLSVDGGM